MRTTPTPSLGRGGFTLLELVYSTTILTILMISLAICLTQIQQITATGQARQALQHQAHSVLERIATDLAASGSVEIDGLDYPLVYEVAAMVEGVDKPTAKELGYEKAEDVPDSGSVDEEYGLEMQDAPWKSAHDGEADFGWDQGIVIACPNDVDRDGVPDLDEDGEIDWDDGAIVYRLVPLADGTNDLVRTDPEGVDDVLAHGVERVVFDDSTSSNFDIPLDAVRVRIFFRETDEAGLVQRYRVSRVVRLKNTPEVGF